MAKSKEDLIVTTLGIGLGWSVAQRTGGEKLLKQYRISANELKFAIENFKKHKGYVGLIGSVLTGEERERT